MSNIRVIHPYESYDPMVSTEGLMDEKSHQSQ